MALYQRHEAREWAHAHLKGVANVVIPSFTADLKGLNEQGIRHDIRHEIALGFSGTLLVSEVAMSLAEYEQFFQWSNDEAQGRLQLIHHASFNTLEENIEAAKIAERQGAALILLSYPANFYAATSQDIYDYTKAFCDATRLGVMLFQVPHWGFDRVHPSDIDAALIRRLLDDCPNICALKAEGGMPSIMGWVEAYRLFSKEVVVTMPLEQFALALGQLVPIQFIGTSDTEYYGGMIPRIFKLMQEHKYDEATALYWQINPARKARAAANAYSAQAQFLNRMLWKYEGWLNGFNGGPLRQPTMRINEGTMNSLRQALVKSGITPTDLPNGDFFTGRHPVATVS
jgi:4-hydroxy-tetrahydrodipicolinate synthase